MNRAVIWAILAASTDASPQHAAQRADLLMVEFEKRKFDAPTLEIHIGPIREQHVDTH